MTAGELVKKLSRIAKQCPDLPIYYLGSHDDIHIVSEITLGTVDSDDWEDYEWQDENGEEFKLSDPAVNSVILQ